jgi:aquaporin Z
VSTDGRDWQAPLPGFHVAQWLAELAGTAILVFGGVSAICLDFGPGSPVTAVVPSHSLRLLLTGLLFAGTGSLVAISPLGRLSGAHLNPAVTFAFWIRGHAHANDLAGYIGAQMVGGLVGAASVIVAWGTVATAVRVGATAPGPGVPPVVAVLLEALMTALLVLAIFVMLGSERTARLTPLAVWIVVALLVWQGAPYTGTSLNPARSFGPAVLAGALDVFWIYLVGPMAGAAAIAGLSRLLGARRRPLTAKLFYDPAYPSVMMSSMPVREPPGDPRRQNERHG